MDLAGMINNGVEALHRGSVDRSGAQPPPNNDKPAGRTPAAPAAAPAAQTNKVPPWAHVFRGSRNKVRDVRRWQLAETRPELSGIFSAAPEPEEASEKADSKPSVSQLGSQSLATINMPPASISEIGPGGNASLSGLVASLAGMVPNDDQTQYLGGWIYERIQELSDVILDSLEIEFKVGMISGEHSGIRHRFPVLSEAVVDPIYFQQQRLHFRSEIDDSAFKSLETLLDSLAMANAGSENNSIERQNVLLRDEMHSVQIGESRQRVRVSFDDKERVIECIIKKRIGDLYISMPNSAYDLKMSLSSEEPVRFEDIADQLKGAKASYERNKNRLKWRAQGCTVDLTSVHGSVESGAPAVTKEAEIETNGQLLASILHEVRESSDKATALDKFLEIVRYTMDSARFLVRRI